MEVSQIPNHVAIIMDGNGRWASKLHLSTVDGHEKGAKVAKEIVEYAAKIGIKYLTLYTFSSENWLRSEEEVLGIMSLLKAHIASDRNLIVDNNIKLKVIGDFTRLSKELRSDLKKLEEETSSNTGMTLVIALSYGSRNEILNAITSLLKVVEEKKILSQDITEEFFAKHLYTNEMPDPDLLIRTGKEQRLSNFLLWQIAYTELYFSEVMWPDFTTKHFDDAIAEFIKRERRYGK
ncbi:MAG: isoprenyl transferase [Rickettsiales bacterium]|nr:isoprenyl transferase [Rickettsiales bacterium]